MSKQSQSSGKLPTSGSAAEAAKKKPKPAILCLHGSGTSAMIFNIQTIRLQRQLQDVFDFVFIDAPIESPPGPGVVPVFEECGPYWAWQYPSFSHTEQMMPQETIDVLADTMDRQIATTGQPFVGVLGFSQGTRVAAGLLLQQQRDQKTGRDQDQGWGRRMDFRFGIFLNGSKTPLLSDSSLATVGKIVDIPSVHVIGLQDPFMFLARSLHAEYFEPQHASVIELNVAHHLPVAPEDTAKIVREIVRLYMMKPQPGSDADPYMMGVTEEAAGYRMDRAFEEERIT